VAWATLLADNVTRERRPLASRVGADRAIDWHRHDAGVGVGVEAGFGIEVGFGVGVEVEVEVGDHAMQDFADGTVTSAFPPHMRRALHDGARRR
jgi:hypothetical protein